MLITQYFAFDRHSFGGGGLEKHSLASDLDSHSTQLRHDPFKITTSISSTISNFYFLTFINKEAYKYKNYKHV